MSAFNLVNDPWIPVRWRDGRHSSTVSLAEAFTQGAKIADLACAPHERVALIRLLVCVAQATVGAPPGPNDWPRWQPGLDKEVPAYLEKWKHRFQLFGEGNRFLQTPVPVKGDPVHASKLIPNLATGNNPTLLDHLGGTPRAFPADRLALALLAFQMFYPLYGAGYKGKGPCVDGNMVHAVMRGEQLLQTIRLNCLDETTIRAHFPESGMGRPLWELDEGMKSEATDTATLSYLGRLVPRHRNLWLLDDGSGFHLTTAAWIYPTFPAAREPSSTIILRKKGPAQFTAVLPAYLDRSLWRDLHYLSVVRETDGADIKGAPLVIQSHIEEFNKADLLLWTGALVTDLKAKILDTVESSFALPPKLFRSFEVRRRYESGVAFAENTSKRVFAAVKAYATNLKNSENPPTALAQQTYWNQLDQECGVLLDLVRRHGTPEDPMATADFGKRQDDSSFDPWTRRVRAAARKAYEDTCPARTPRQQKAHVVGLRVLFPKPKKSTTKSSKPQ